MLAPQNYDYIVVGAGPAGLQMAYFLQKSGRRYVVYEADKEAASFFRNHPRNGRLISINKKNNWFTEDEFNMRHDWNSLLSDDPTMKFTRYSNDLFPQSKDLRRYMNDFAKQFQLNIEFGTKVVKISKQGSEFFVTTQKVESAAEDVCTSTARCVLMASGAVQENLPDNIEGLELADTYSKYQLDKSKYRDKMVLVVGGGNSGFETADFLSDTAAIVHVSIRKRIQFAWNTHYVGDLRAVNNSLLDMYLLKSLHATFAYEVIKITKDEQGKFVVTFKILSTNTEEPGWTYSEMKYDHVICCLGWKYTHTDLFDDSIHIELVKDNRFPRLSSCWESDTENLFYIGTTMASIDRQSASGFVHGFRYNIRTIHNLLENRLFHKELVHEILPIRDLQTIAEKVLDRFSISASLYQMNGFLCDVMTCEKEGNTKYYTDLPRNHVMERSEFRSAKDVFIILLVYGFDKFGKTEKPIDEQNGPEFGSNKCAAFLHPQIEHFRYGEYVDQMELHESFVIRYDSHAIKTFTQWSHATTLNYFKFFVNDKMNWSDETFSLSINVSTDEPLTITPLTEEEKSRITPVDRTAECHQKKKLQPKQKIAPPRPRKLRPTRKEKLALALP